MSAGRLLGSPPGNNSAVATYTVNKRAVEKAKQLIAGRQYVLDSDWGDVQPNAAAENAYLESHSWDEYGEWHLGLTEGSADDTKARHAFVYRRLPPSASDGDHRLPLPRGAMASQRDRARTHDSSVAGRDERLTPREPRGVAHARDQRTRASAIRIAARPPDCGAASTTFNASGLPP